MRNDIEVFDISSCPESFLFLQQNDSSFFFVSQDHTTNAAVSANTVAHEMGHNLGFYHNSKLKALFPIYVAKFY